MENCSIFEKTKVSKIHSHIIFFDGECNLCNGFVDFVIRTDKKNRFKFDSLQNENSKLLLINSSTEEKELNSVVYYRNGVFLTKSTAALFILFDLGVPYSIAIVFWVVPSFIRNWVYDFIAANRYDWFGKRNTCRVPSEAEKEKFL